MVVSPLSHYGFGLYLQEVALTGRQFGRRHGVSGNPDRRGEMRRIYFLIPDVQSAREIIDELLLKRIEWRHVHVLARAYRSRI